MKIRLDFPYFTSAETAKAAGFTPANFRLLFSRGHFRDMGGDRKSAEKEGTAHQYSLRDVRGYALAKELIKFGTDPKTAWEIAMVNFAHTGSAKREPGSLFDVHEDGYTGFTYWPDIKQGRVFCYENAPDFNDLFYAHNSHRQYRFAFVQMNDLLSRVHNSLDLDERKFTL